MKTASFGSYHGHRAALGNHAGESIFKRILAGSHDLIQAMKKQSDSFAAIGLAEGGDVEGAAQLMERSKRK